MCGPDGRAGSGRDCLYAGRGLRRLPEARPPDNPGPVTQGRTFVNVDTHTFRGRHRFWRQGAPVSLWPPVERTCTVAAPRPSPGRHETQVAAATAQVQHPESACCRSVSLYACFRPPAGPNDPRQLLSQRKCSIVDPTPCVIWPRSVLTTLFNPAFPPVRIQQSCGPA